LVIYRKTADKRVESCWYMIEFWCERWPSRDSDWLRS